MVEKLENITKLSKREQSFVEKMKSRGLFAAYVTSATMASLSLLGLGAVAAMPGNLPTSKYVDVNNDGVKDKVIGNNVYLGHEHYEGVFRELYYSREPKRLTDF